MAVADVRDVEKGEYVELEHGYGYTVITMPKTKTHRMACMTNSLKILVGINGDKDFLPHHRIGSAECGGDCYKEHSVLRSFSEKIWDFANRHQGTWLYKPSVYSAIIAWKLSRPDKKTLVNAGWFGNDTVWRMVMDLNLIALYGKPDGTLSDKPQRTLYTLCDAIIGGEGEGPLYPPLPLGMLTFSNDAYLSDEIMGHVWKLNIDKIPLLKEAKRLNSEKDIKLFIEGKAVNVNELNKLSIDVKLSPGWEDYNK